MENESKKAELVNEQLEQVSGGAGGCVDSLRITPFGERMDSLRGALVGATGTVDSLRCTPPAGSAFASPTVKDKEAPIDPLDIPAALKPKDDSVLA